MRTKKLFFSMFLFLFSSGFLFAQQIKIKGLVTDDSGAKLPGVNVKLKGSNKGVSTGFYGSFEIEVPKGSTLQFSYLGCISQELATPDSGALNVILKTDAKQLDGVVVTAFGVQSKSKSLGYATQTVKASDVERPGQVNALESLQGSVAGVSINRTSGAAGSGIDILIRGVSSLNATSNNQPLIIIDGNPMNNNTSSGNVQPSKGSNSPSSSEQFSFSNRSIDINPNDIESYSVLKGAGATALYGILGGNGVIIITTKKGKEGKTKINISSSTSFSSVNKFPELQSKYREGVTYNDGSTESYVVSTNADVAGGISYIPGLDFGFRSFGPEYSSSDDPSIKFRDTNRDFFKTGINQSLNVSISGGNEKMNFFVSASNSIDSGIIPNTEYNKKTFRASGNYKLNDKMKLGSSVTYANSGGVRANIGDKSIMSSLSYWSPSIDINDYLTKDGKQKNYASGIIDNPRYFAEKSNLNDNVDRWIAAADFDWNPKSWLNVMWRGSVDNYSETRNRFVPEDLDVGTQVGGFVLNATTNFRALNSTLIVSATKSFGKFNTKLFVGNQIADDKTIASSIRGEKLLIEGFNTISNATNFFPSNPGAVVNRTVGFFGELKTDFNEVLYLSFTGRRDKVSTLPLNNNGFNYYSANLAFVFTELLDKDRKFLSYGKLRTSYAQSGKIPPNGVNGRYSYPDGNFPFNGVGGVSLGSVTSNPAIVAEIVTTKEIGTDLKFFNDRLRLEYTFFDRRSNSQLIPYTPSFASSLTTVWDNSGELKTFGHELTLGLDVVKNQSFRWTTLFNFTTYRSEVLSLPFESITFAQNSQSDTASRIKVGDAIGSLYGYTWDYRDGKVLIGSDGLPVIKEDDVDFVLSKVGNAFPDWTGSVNNVLKYKNFNFSFLLEYKKGGEAFDAGQRNGIRNGILKITEERGVQRILDGVNETSPGVYVPNTIPTTINAPNYYRSLNYNLVSETLIQDASWVKLRNISFGYDLPTSVLSKLKLSNASFTVSGGNFLIWTPFRGYDPEGNQYSAGSNTYGFTGLNVPLTQSYSFGINLGF